MAEKAQDFADFLFLDKKEKILCAHLCTHSFLSLFPFPSHIPLLSIPVSPIPSVPSLLLRWISISLNGKLIDLIICC
jgi:hypothetical protein